MLICDADFAAVVLLGCWKQNNPYEICHTDMCLCFVCLIYCFTSVKTAEVMSGQSNLTTLFQGKPTRGSLPVFIALHSFASNGQLALLESAEGGNISLGKNVPDGTVDLGSICI